MSKTYCYAYNKISAHLILTAVQKAYIYNWIEKQYFAGALSRDEYNHLILTVQNIRSK